MWEALLTRGPQSVTWEKVKGHATSKHIEMGRAIAETKEGNDWVDHYATKGTEQHQEGATQLAKWLASRQNDYAKFMAKIQTIIVAVLKKKKKKGSTKKKSKKCCWATTPRGSPSSPADFRRHMQNNTTASN